MKIIQVSAYYPPRLGGMQNVVRELSEGLASRGFSVEVYTSKIGANKNKTYIQPKKNLNIHYLKGLDVAHTAIIPGLPFALLKAPKDSIIHVHAPRPYVLEATALIAKLRGIPYIVHFHSDIQPMGALKFLIEPYKKNLAKRALRGAAMTIFLTESQEKEFKDFYKLTRTAIVPNGVADRYFQDRNIQPKKDLREAQILFVGRLNHHKNIPLLINAVAQMTCPAMLNIVGDGEMREELKQLIKNCGFERKIKLRGAKTGKELLALYRQADIFVMASKSEGFSLAMLEAMAAGVPIVATNSPGIVDLVKNTGLIVKSEDPKIFARQLDKLLSDDEKASQLSRKSMDMAQQYKWSTVLARLQAIYRKIQEDK